MKSLYANPRRTSRRAVITDNFRLSASDTTVRPGFEYGHYDVSVQLEPQNDPPRIKTPQSDVTVFAGTSWTRSIFQAYTRDEEILILLMMKMVFLSHLPHFMEQLTMQGSPS